MDADRFDMIAKAIQRLQQRKLSAAIGFILTLGVGTALLLLPRLGDWHAHLSYDYSNLIIPSEVPTHALIVYMDEISYRKLHQSYEKLWDRALHADLLERLNLAGAEMVVFDVFFSDPGTSAEADSRLAQAISDFGKVVLAAELEPVNDPRMKGAERPIPPRDKFEEAARGRWGIAKVYKHAEEKYGFAVRKIYTGDRWQPGLVWVAAREAGAPVTQVGSLEEAERMAQQYGLPRRFGGDRQAYMESVVNAVRTRERWLHYYGPSGTVPRLSYHRALRVMSVEELGTLVEGKTVFIGGKPQTPQLFEQVENFATPYTRLDGKATAGVEVTATMFLNLVRNDWLNRMSPGKEFLLVVLSALVFGVGLRLLSPLTGIIVAVVGAAAIVMGGLMLAKGELVWFAWAIPALAQVPCAYGSALIAARVPQAARVPVTAPAGVEIPDYSLRECLRRGDYGELWLAQDAQGGFHGVKVVYRDRFERAGAYQREFRTLQSYLPISQSHSNLLPLQKVERQADFFYAVMPIADDQEAGRQIDPRRYNPRTLARDISRHGHLPADDCLELGAALVEGLQHLHRERLVHGNIKPSNILFVEGQPQLAEIGQAVVVSRIAEEKTGVGHAYAPPEGNDSPVSDLYSLGMVLYTASTGLDPDRFPEPPSRATDALTGALINDLNRIIAQACHASPGRRFKTASEMHRALLSTLNKHLDRKRRDTAVPVQSRARERIAGYKLLSRIGHGAFGEVWLARNKVGLYQAVKIVSRERFSHSDPYEREFEGLKHFMGISRSHPGFVHILHVDRDNDAGFFYYCMEAGDDEATGQNIDPDNYKPRSLSGELKRRGALPPMDALELIESLAETVEHLHGRELLHRDIKPANVIFVNGLPKLADIGLVTHMPQEKDVTVIGTPGYMAPEGPQGRASDVFSLGMLFYVVLTCRSPERFDEVPEAIRCGPRSALIDPIMGIIRKACMIDPKGRYQTAGELWQAVADLREAHDEDARPTQVN